MAKLYAIVATLREGENLVTFFLSGSPALVEDIDENYDAKKAEEVFGEPSEAGFWMWAGVFESRRGLEGNYDGTYMGEYRRLTATELVKLYRGEQLWPEEWANWQRMQEE